MAKESVVLRFPHNFGTNQPARHQIDGYTGIAVCQKSGRIVIKQRAKVEIKYKRSFIVSDTVILSRKNLKYRFLA